MVVLQPRFDCYSILRQQLAFTTYVLVMQEYERKFVRPEMFQEVYSHIQVLATEHSSPYVTVQLVSYYALQSGR